MVEPAFYSIGDACAAFGCGRTRLYELLSGGKIEAKKLGRKTLISVASLREYFASLPDPDINVALRRKPIGLGEGSGDNPRHGSQVLEKPGAATEARSGRGRQRKSDKAGQEAI